jgi:hypothetical protein
MFLHEEVLVRKQLSRLGTYITPSVFSLRVENLMPSFLTGSNSEHVGPLRHSGAMRDGDNGFLGMPIARNDIAPPKRPQISGASAVPAGLLGVDPRPCRRPVVLGTLWEHVQPPGGSSN